jgi:uncharacterized membrane protein
MDTIHPIVVHFVIAMGLITFVFDLIGVPKAAINRSRI